MFMWPSQLLSREGVCLGEEFVLSNLSASAKEGLVKGWSSDSGMKTALVFPFHLGTFFKL